MRGSKTEKCHLDISIIIHLSTSFTIYGSGSKGHLVRGKVYAAVTTSNVTVENLGVAAVCAPFLMHSWWKWETRKRHWEESGYGALYSWLSVGVWPKSIVPPACSGRNIRGMDVKKCPFHRYHLAVHNQSLMQMGLFFCVRGFQHPDNMFVRFLIPSRNPFARFPLVWTQLFTSVRVGTKIL